MMYRLDFVGEDGQTTGDVRGWHISVMPVTETVLCRHMTTARQRAIQAAKEWDQPVLITRIGKNGQLRPCLIVAPDGSAKPPARMRTGSGPDCQAGKGAGACFCANCRAARRGR